MMVFEPLEDAFHEHANPGSIAAGLSLSEVVLLAECEEGLGKRPEPLGQRKLGPGPPQEPLLQGFHEAVQLRRGIFNILVTYAGRDAHDRPAGAPRPSQSDGGGAFPERSQTIAIMVDFALREDDQGMWAGLDDLDGLPKGFEIMTLAIDTEAAMALQDPTTDRAEKLKDLPGHHVMAWPP